MIVDDAGQLCLVAANRNANCVEQATFGLMADVLWDVVPCQVVDKVDGVHFLVTSVQLSVICCLFYVNSTELVTGY